MSVLFTGPMDACTQQDLELTDNQTTFGPATAGIENEMWQFKLKVGCKIPHKLIQT